MTKEKTRAAFDKTNRLDGPALIAVWGSDAPDDEFRLGTWETDWHAHARGQFFCIESGLLHLRTAAGSWLLPPHRAGWLPPGELHWVSVSGVASGWSILVAPDAGAGLPARPCVFAVSELMRALVRRAATWAEKESLAPEEERIAGVLFDELRQAQALPLHLPMPTDRRLLRIATALLKRPHDNRTLAQWAVSAGLSPRTARRLFLAETDMSFARWRQQARLTLGLERLAAGQSVAAVSDALGYASPSNFIAMFRRCFGESPARYFAARVSDAD